MKSKKKKYSVRDTWIPESWRYNGVGFQKDKKKIIPRKQKYRGLTNPLFGRGLKFTGGREFCEIINNEKIFINYKKNKKNVNFP